MLVTGDPKGDLAVMKGQHGIGGIRRAPRQLLGGQFIATEGPGPCRIQEHWPIPGRIG